MSIGRHGISIGIERIGNDSILTFKAVGRLTHADYEALAPLLDSSLEGIKSTHIKMLVDITEFSGWELRAAWDDFKLGQRIGFNIDKIAIYGDKNWQELAAKIGSWFISGNAQSFDNYNAAVEWLRD